MRENINKPLLSISCYRLLKSSAKLRLRHSKKNNGFTLVELMVSIAIVGILTAIAVPYFADYLQRGKISQGISTLTQLATQMERSYLDYRQYTNNGGCAVANRSDDYFNYSCTSKTGQDFLWIASSLDGNYEYRIDQDNNRSTSKYKGSTSVSDCWLIAIGSCY